MSRARWDRGWGRTCRASLGALSACSVLVASCDAPAARPAVPPADDPAATGAVASALPEGTTPTFAGGVAGVLRERCGACHRPGGIATFSLLDYEDARLHAPAALAAVESGRMPPWLPARGSSDFRRDPTLTPGELALLRRWVAEGAPPGDTADLGPPPPAPGGWTLGEPDLVVELPRPYLLRPGRHDVFRNFAVPVPVPEGGRWVRAVDFIPTVASAVHHASIMVDPTPASRRLDAADPEPGFEGDMLVAGGARNPSGFVVGWTPGRVPDPGRPDLAWRLDEGADLVVQLHLRPGAEPATVSARVGLYFADSAPPRPATVLRLASEAIDIPAGAAEHAIEDAYVLPVPVELTAVYPHAHFLGRSMALDAFLPDGTRRELLRIPRWDFDWQDEYDYREPVALPRGTRLHMRFVYDNSAANPDNPHAPPRRVTYGPHATDEMGDLWLQVVVRDSADLRALRQDFALKNQRVRLEGLRHLVRLAPDSAGAHNDLGNALFQVGRREEAVRHWREALRLAPGFGLAHYHLGVALATGEEGEEGLRHLLAADRLLSDDFVEPRLALAEALAAAGRHAEAEARYRRVLRSSPEDARAALGLGRSLRASGSARAAVAALRDAMRLDPEWEAPPLELAWTLATHPDERVRRPAEAVRLARRGVELAGASEDPLLLETLAAAHAAAGDFIRALPAAERALRAARARGDDALIARLEAALSGYRSGRPYVDADVPASPG